MNMHATPTATRRIRRGFSTVEAALVLPLVLMVTFGTIEYGWMFLKAHQIAGANRHGARLAALPGANPNQVRAAVQQLLADQAGLSAGSVTVQIIPDNPDGAAPGSAITVRTTVPYSAVELTGFTLIPAPASLTAEMVVAKEGP